MLSKASRGRRAFSAFCCAKCLFTSSLRQRVFRQKSNCKPDVREILLKALHVPDHGLLQLLQLALVVLLATSPQARAVVAEPMV